MSERRERPEEGRRGAEDKEPIEEMLEGLHHLRRAVRGMARGLRKEVEEKKIVEILENTRDEALRALSRIGAGLGRKDSPPPAYSEPPEPPDPPPPKGGEPGGDKGKAPRAGDDEDDDPGFTIAGREREP